MYKERFTAPQSGKGSQFDISAIPASVNPTRIWLKSKDGARLIPAVRSEPALEISKLAAFMSR